jgi:hypothetical protein
MRESHITTLIGHANEHIWATLYLILSIGEYVDEILEVTYDNRSSLNDDFITQFKAEWRATEIVDCHYRRKYPKNVIMSDFNFSTI